MQPPVALVAPVADPINGLRFHNFIAALRLIQANLIFPVPTAQAVTAVGAIRSFVTSGLFKGQTQAFLEVLMTLATKADAARR